MEITELDGLVSPVEPIPPAPAPPADPEKPEKGKAESPRQHQGSNRVAPVDLEKGAELQLVQPPAGITTIPAADHMQAGVSKSLQSSAADDSRGGSGDSLASTSALKSAQAAWLDIRNDATDLPGAVRQKVRLGVAHVHPPRMYPFGRHP